jgi:arylsulfatase A-like enzyme
VLPPNTSHLKGWDTHENGHTRLQEMKKQIDGPVAQLIRDLDEKGLLDRTMVVLASEFSRDMMVEGRPDAKVKEQVAQPDILSDLKFYGMHRHFTDGCSMLMFGGGIKKGFVYGKTADERPCKTIENPVKIDGIHQTIYHALGIPADTQYEIEKRPFYTTPDGKGLAVKELLS